MTSAGLDSVLTLAQRSLGVMQPRPLTTLHVGGDITADGILKGGSLAVTGNATIGGSLTVGGNFQTDSLTVVHNATVGGSLTVGAGLNVTGTANFISTQTYSVGTTAGSVATMMLQAGGPSAGGGGAFMAFHRPGAYATYFGLDTDNVFKVGGWSMGGVAFRVVLGDSYDNAGALIMGGDIHAGGANNTNTVWAASYQLGASGSYYINVSSNICQIANMNLLSWGWVGFASNPAINLNWNGSGIVASHPLYSSNFICNAAGYAIEWGDTNNSIYSDKATLNQWAATGTTWRYYSTGIGHYFDLVVDSGNHTTLGGTNNLLYARRFDIVGNTCGIDLGRAANEVSTWTHTYMAGSGYCVLDFSATSVTQRSSRKIKAGIVPLESDDAIKRVRDTRSNPVKFRWSQDEWDKRQALPKAPKSPEPRMNQVGFVAEDMHHVVPEAVSYDTETSEPTGINYGVLTSVLWAAVRHLDARVQELEARPA